jgi:hypothetical protein
VVWALSVRQHKAAFGIANWRSQPRIRALLILSLPRHLAGLTVALASREQPSSLPDLETRLRRGFHKRLAFCDSVKEVLPAQTAGEKGLIDTIVGGTIGPLIDAIKAIWLRIRDDNARSVEASGGTLGPPDMARPPHPPSALLTLPRPLVTVMCALA